MKINLLLFVLFCNSGYSQSSPVNKNPISIIGKPFKIGSLEIAQHDFPKSMAWEDAKNACDKLGSGWRLPTMEELDIMFKERVKIGLFKKGNIKSRYNQINEYWSSDLVSQQTAFINTLNFGPDGSGDKSNHSFDYDGCLVRAVKGTDTSEKFVMIGNLGIYKNDISSEINWYDANTACGKLGDGWRLPTINELEILYQNKSKIGGFSGAYYWSSTPASNGYVWYQHFGYGNKFNYGLEKTDKMYARPVRTF